MKSPALTLKLFAALLAGSALLTSLPAEAGRDGHERHWRQDRHADHRAYRHDYRDDHRRWDDHRGRGHKHGHYKDRHSHGERVVIKEKVIVQHRPVVREHYYYDRPYPAYSYSRDPAIVIGVNVPPIVIPLR